MTTSMISPSATSTWTTTDKIEQNRTKVAHNPKITHSNVRDFVFVSPATCPVPRCARLLSASSTTNRIQESRNVLHIYTYIIGRTILWTRVVIPLKLFPLYYLGRYLGSRYLDCTVPSPQKLACPPWLPNVSK